ncbi:phage tail protein [Berryella intestinalis]|uniref:phage tail protein n=1 Tax=Berryella intestinalis TaxID=1531429 RepID=UPI00118610E5|nr:phage tail protein [Berryella intestinalis]
MPRIYRPVIDVDCPIKPDEHIAGLESIPELFEGTGDLQRRCDHIKKEIVSASSPCGTYKFFNPAPCTLPPDYTEPAIKLVGTMSVLHGEAVYNKLRKATHCVLMGACLGPSFDEDDLKKKLVHDEIDAAIFSKTIEALVAHTANVVNAEIVKSALEEGCYTDDYLGYSESNGFPLESVSDILFYMKGEERLGMHVTEEGKLGLSCPGTIGIVAVFDPDKGPKRSCGLCKFRDFCSIRSIGMTCHGKTGAFKREDT